MMMMTVGLTLASKSVLQTYEVEAGKLTLK